MTTTAPTEVDDYIATEIAKLVRVVDSPVGAVGYGRDLACIDDLIAAPNGELVEVDPNSVEAIRQAQARRLSTTRGSLLDDPDYGYNLVGRLNAGVTQRDLIEISAQAKAELLKDDRAEDVRVDVELYYSPVRLRVEVFTTPADPRLTDFAATFAVTDSDLLLESIR